MPYNILGINPVHNSSVALVSDGKLIYYLEEERLSKVKKDSNPFRAIHEVCQKYSIDEVVIGGTNNIRENYLLPWTGETLIETIIKKYFPKIPIRYTKSAHHLSHAFCAFLNSGFSSSIVLVIDGAGSKQEINNITCWESESIFEFHLNEGFKEIYKRYLAEGVIRHISSNMIIDNAPGIAKVYEGVSSYLGFHALDGGKTMGLAPYGKKNSLIPSLFKEGKGNRDLFINLPPNIAIVDIDSYPHLKGAQHTTTLDLLLHNSSRDWHKDFSKTKQIEKDFAWAAQEETQKEVVSLIEKAVNITGLDKVCIAGGYGLNCVNNYFLQKKFPNLKIYFEPISHDGGTSIGSAYIRLKQLENNFKLNKLESLYLGPKYSKEELLEGIKKYVDN